MNTHVEMMKILRILPLKLFGIRVYAWMFLLVSMKAIISIMHAYDKNMVFKYVFLSGKYFTQ